MPIRVQIRLFAALRELAGSGRVELEAPDGTTAEGAWELLGLGERPAALAIAVNREYADGGRRLADGDELAFIPPVSGGAARPQVALSAEPLDIAALVAQVAAPGAGAIATFIGTVRDATRGRDVERLEYEAYPEMATAELERICATIAERHALTGIAVVHRTGACAIGDATVAIATSAAHRAAALEACREAIDTLKARVPIWKKEVYADGESWLGSGS